jgi:GNAT superfamily N-acetyltransferase
MSISTTSTLSRESSLELRPIRFEEVASILGLIERAIERGCREHYTPAQRKAVFLSYARRIFAEVPGPFESIVATREEAPLGFAQVDPAAGWLRALFVDAGVQHRGIGSQLLAEVERRTRQCGGRRLTGAMSLNAVPFYTLAGFRPLSGTDRLTSADVSVPIVPMEKLFRN